MSPRVENNMVDRKTFLRIFITVFLPMFLAAVDQTLLATATPTIASQLGNLQLSSWIAIGYMLASAASVPVYGWLGDRHGRKPMLMTALVIFALGSLFCSFSTSMTWLIIGRVIQGLGSGGLMSLSQALIGELVPPRQRARFQGYFSGLFALASIGGPMIGGLIVTYLSWPWLFWFNLPLIGLALYRLATFSIPSSPRQNKEPIDIGGLILFPTLMTIGIYWLSAGGHYFAWASTTSISLISVLLFISWLFIAQQRRVRASFLPLALLAQREIYIPLLSTFIFAACLFALIFFLPIYLQLGLGVSPAHSGLLLIPLSCGLISGAFITGKVIAKTGIPKYLPVFGMGLSSVAFMIMALVTLPAHGVSAIAALCGLGLGTVMPSTQVLIQTIAGKANLGRITAMASLSRSLGASVGTALFGTLIYSLLPGLSANTGTQVLTDLPAAEVLSAFKIGFLLAALFAFCGLLNALRAPSIQLDDYAFDR